MGSMKSAADWVNTYGTAITALATLALCVLTGFYVVLTKETARVSQQQSQLLIDQDRREQNRVRAQLWIRATELESALMQMLTADPESDAGSLKSWDDSQLISLREAGSALDDEVISHLLAVNDALEKLQWHYHAILRREEGSPTDEGRLAKDEWHSTLARAIDSVDQLETLSRPRPAAAHKHSVM